MPHARYSTSRPTSACSRCGKWPVLGTAEQRQLEERVGERGLGLWSEHAGRHAGRRPRQLAALEQGDRGAGVRQVIGRGAADDAAADDDDVRADAGQRPTPTSPASGLDGMA